MLRLVTIPISHYCERARWALDRAGIDYEEEQHLQTFHWRHVARHGGRRTVPVLVTPRHVLDDSEQILRWVDASLPGEERLYDGSTEAEALSVRLAGEFGVEARRWAYGYFFRMDRSVLHYNDGVAPRVERAGLRLLRPMIEPGMRRYLGVFPDRIEAAFAVVRRTFDEIGERLADGRPFLCGDRFGAADLTFATMSAPLVLPERYGMPLPRPEELPADTAPIIRELRAHAAGAFALRVFDERPPVRARFVH